MADYLVFRLYGPMSSWGTIAVGESRHSADHPSRSALLGLLGSALGIRRSDEDRQRDLTAAWRFGIKLWSPGVLLRDYHTVQAPRKQSKVRFRTRHQELTAPIVNTLLSSREYRLDSVSVVALERTDQAAWTLAELREGLLRPQFALYLGRKSCPLALPLAPQIVAADSLRAALDSPQSELAALGWFGKSNPAPWPSDHDRRRLGIRNPRYYWENGMVPDEATAYGGDFHPSLDTVRYDQPLSRKRWQFEPRRESVFTPPEDPS